MLSSSNTCEKRPNLLFTPRSRASVRKRLVVQRVAVAAHSGQSSQLLMTEISKVVNTQAARTQVRNECKVAYVPMRRFADMNSGVEKYVAEIVRNLDISKRDLYTPIGNTKAYMCSILLAPTREALSLVPLSNCRSDHPIHDLSRLQGLD